MSAAERLADRLMAVAALFERLAIALLPGDAGEDEPAWPCPVCDGGVEPDCPHVHDLTTKQGDGRVVCWTTDTPGAVLVTDEDGGNPAVWAS